MKRFFSRFSTAGPTSPTKAPTDTTYDRSEKQDLALPGGPSPAPAVHAPYNSIGRTKALVAKFEGSITTQSTLPKVSTDLSTSPKLNIPIPSVESSLSELPLGPSDYVVASPVPGSVPKRIPGSSLPADAKQYPKSDAFCLRNDSKAPHPSNHDKEQRQASSGSQTASSNTHASKTVAFAPSPQKQRSTSPAQNGSSQRPFIAQPISRTNSNDSNPVNGGSSFARPTAASQARSRTWTRSAASDTSQYVSSSNQAHSTHAKGASSYSRSSRSGQASSARSTARRAYSHTSGPDGRGGGSLAATPAALIIGNRTNDTLATTGRGTSIDIAQNGRASPAQRTDLASSPTGPLQFPTRTSLPMRMSYSGSNSSRPTSRRNSVDPASLVGSTEPVVFLPSSVPAMRSFGFPTWSEMTHQELVQNLGPRERTRQEVLWEIVASEERYVTELEKAKEFYIDALIHPDQFDPERILPPVNISDATSPIYGATPSTTAISNGSAMADASAARSSATAQSSGDLPIAARFMSSVSAGKNPSTSLDVATRSLQSQWDAQNAAGARSPYSVGVSKFSTSDKMIARPGQSQDRMEGSYGLGLGLGTTATRDRSTAAYMNVPVASKGKGKVSKAQKLRVRSGKTSGESDPLRLSVPLPPSLREVLFAMSDGLVEAHGLLLDALKARYEEQWPLVRSLADVFMKYSHILEHYASYVCHLQRAMEELEEAALMERAFRGKRLKKERLSNTVGLGRTVAAFEACAAEQGYAGLSIFASMPFQRLLKYPLLFQNLLFHTDPSTHEFESTVAMVVEVERLVRSIEDEKVNAEERDKTRDVFARIDGITDRQVLRPRSDRILVEERALYDEHARRTLSESAPKEGKGNPHVSDSEGGESGTEGDGQPGFRGGGRRASSNQAGLRAALRNKRSYRRLSDFLSSEETGGGSTKAPAMGSKKDLWIVRFSDVEIKCQRIGVTALPMVSSAALRDVDASEHDETSDFSARSKDSRERLKALRNTTLRAKTRNLYKFISVVAWRSAALRQVDGAKDGYPEGLPTSHEVDEEDEEDDDDGASISSEGSSATSSSSSSSSDGVGGQAGSEKYIRSTKLSFTYWGDRIEPGRGITGVQTNATADGQAKTQAGDRSSRRSEVQSTTSSQRGPQRTVDSTVTTGSVRQARYSTPTGRSTRPGGRGGMSGRLSEPLAATSLSFAPESMQTAVAQMHARQRNEKFGGRLRTSLANGSAVTPLGRHGEANGSHVSVNSTSNGITRRGSGTTQSRGSH